LFSNKSVCNNCLKVNHTNYHYLYL
jgi:hypothetical protein